MKTVPVNFFKSAERITRSLARLTATARALLRTVDRDPATPRAGRYLQRAARRMTAESRALQERARAFSQAGDGLIAWFQERRQDRRIATFALTSFRQIAASAIEQHRAFRDGIATAPALVDQFDAARAALLASLDESIDAMRRTLASCNTVPQTLQRER